MTTTNIPSDSMMVLEEIIDGSSLEELLGLVIDVCYAKAEHLRSNWQDHNAAKAWERDAAKILRVANRLEN